MVLTAQIWIKNHHNMFVYLGWLNWPNYQSVQLVSVRLLNIVFLLIIISSASFLGSGFKFIFHWKGQLLIFSKYPLGSPAKVIIPWITENRDVSSANSLQSLLRPSDKFLIYNKNRKGPGIDPWETPAQLSVRDEHWLFKNTFCFLLQGNSSKIL